MKKYQLTSLLAALTAPEMERLEHYLQAAYFNTNPSVLHLFAVLKPYHPHYDAAPLELSDLYSAVFPDNDYRPGTLRNLMTELTDLLRNFLQQLEMEENKALQERLLLRQLAKRKVEKEYNALYNKVKKRKSTQVLDRINYLQEYLSLEQFYHFPFTPRFGLPPQHMQDAVRNLDRFFTLSKLLLRIEIQSRRRLMGEKEPLSVYNETVDTYIQDLPARERPLFLMLQFLSQLQNDPDKAKIKKATEIYYQQQEHFSGFDNKLILKTLINLMNQIFKDRDSNYLKRMFKLYDFGITQQILIYDSSLTVLDFLNIVTTATRSGEKAWTQRFMAENLQYLPKQEQAEVGLLAKAMIDFERGAFKKVIASLSASKIRNSSLGHRYRHLLIKCYAELTLLNKMKMDKMIKHLNVFDRYIRRQSERGAEKRSAAILDFIKVTLKILRAHESEAKVNKAALRKAINDKPSITGRYWLLQKIKLLK